MKTRSSTILLYSSTALLSVGILAIVMRLWQADWSIPLGPGPIAGDVLYHAGLIKGLIENAWYFRNPLLGAPGQSVLLDFPYGPNIHMALIKGISLFSGNYGTVFNLYYVLTYPMIALAAVFSFRRFGVSCAPAMLASLLFAFLPYHLMRGEIHIFYAAYFMVPLVGMVALSLCCGELVDVNRALWWKGRRFLAALGICSLTAFDLPYYAYFAAFLCAVAGIYAALREKGTRRTPPIWPRPVCWWARFLFPPRSIQSPPWSTDWRTGGTLSKLSGPLRMRKRLA